MAAAARGRGQAGLSDTIVALSSGQPPAAIGVIRVSGADAFATAAALAGTLPEARRAGLRALRNADGAMLDRALVLTFPGPATATGEDLVELHCHGGRAVVAAVVAALVAHPGCRAAEPGEFTRRALANGRIDLAEAEGLADLLEAETEAQRIAALAAAEGRVSRAVAGWMTRAAMLSARVEASIDYDDEDDVHASGDTVATIVAEAAILGREMAAAAAAPSVERLRDGIRVVLAGPPNAGKSTLLNLLSERDAAIVSPVAGTTRDVIEAPVRRAGLAWLLIDTAGLTRTADVVEAVGVERAQAAAAAADILLWLGDAPPPRDDALWVHARAAQEGRGSPASQGQIVVDRDDPASIDRLWQAIANAATSLLPRTDALPLRERHRRLCAVAAGEMCAIDRDPLIIAERLRRAARALGEIVGVDATESMLDALFSRFCLGK